MKILITNDDGIQGEGLLTLAKALFKAGHTVYVVAPDCNNSAVSHKLTMRERVQVKKCDIGGGLNNAYRVGGSPADCVLIALCALGIKPDMIFSGINDGQNTGSDTLYSGTVAGAMEGAQNSNPSIALSQRIRINMDAGEKTALYCRAAEMTVKHLNEWKNLAAEVEGILNINFPVGELKGITLCRSVRTRYCTSYQYDEGGYLMQFNPPEPVDGDGDIPMLKSGYVTLTPLKLNLTDGETLEKWQK